jgi:hypothetical protein
MDELELGKALGRIEGKLDDALRQHIDCRSDVTRRLTALEQAARPLTAADLWSLVWRFGAGSSAVVVGSAATYAGGRALGLW